MKQPSLCAFQDQVELVLLFACFLLYFSLLTSQLLLSRILIISRIEPNIHFLVLLLCLTHVLKHSQPSYYKRDDKKGLLKALAHRADSITGQWSAALLPPAHAPEIKAALTLWFLHGSIGRSRGRSPFHETCGGYHKTLIHSNHTQNWLWGFPHGRARRSLDLQGASCLLMYLDLKGNWSNSCRRKWTALVSTATLTLLWNAGNLLRCYKATLIKVS